MSTNYEINYEDDRFKDVEADKDKALGEVESTYSGMIDQSAGYYQDQIDAVKDWGEQQSQLQQEQTDFAIEQIEQQKDQTRKDYLKEQSGAYQDWQKQSNEYGANAEAIAAQGMNQTGYSESSQVAMYNSYQNRLATARESYNQAVLNYNNAITEARLQNNSALAEIAYQTLSQSLELSLAGFQYKNQLILDKYNTQLQVEEMYYGRWQDVLDQMNTENALAEQIRQFNETLAEEQRQFNMQYSGYSGGGGGYSSGSSSKSSGDGTYIDKGGDGGTSAADAAFTKSVLNLGYGPISASTLNSKVNSGEVKYNASTNTVSKTNKSTGSTSTKNLYVGKATAALNNTAKKTTTNTNNKLNLYGKMSTK